MKNFKISMLILFLIMGTTACSNDAFQENLNSRSAENGAFETTPENGQDVVEKEEVEELSFIPMAWDGKHRDAEKWSEFTKDAIFEVGESLLDSNPTDINRFCPAYGSLNQEGKLMFWIHLVSSMARFESSFRRETSFRKSFKDRFGNNVISRGLLQLSIESARGYKCDLRNAQDLHDPQRNLECTIKILKRWVDDDNVISKRLSNGKWRGGARYWSVLRHTGANKVKTIAEMTRGNAVCGL